MSTRPEVLDDAERSGAKTLLYGTLYADKDRGVKWVAFLVAVLLHTIALAIHFPDRQKTQVPTKREGVIIVKKYVPPPPRIERRQMVKKKITKKVPIPDPTPDEPEPIREPEIEIEDYEPIPPDVEILLGVPDAPPPPPQVLIAGVGDVTNPVLIESTKVQPEYPGLARAARLESRVVLQAVVTRDGGVGSLEVLACNQPGVGFEESAVAAVQNWRYEPAMQGSRVVEVYFTVVVEFVLQTG